MNKLSCPFCKYDESLGSVIKAYGKMYFELNDNNQLLQSLGNEACDGGVGMDEDNVTYYCTSCVYKTGNLDEFIESKGYKGFYITYRNEFTAKVVGKTYEEALKKFLGNAVDYELAAPTIPWDRYITIQDSETEQEIEY